MTDLPTPPGGAAGPAGGPAGSAVPAAGAPAGFVVPPDGRVFLGRLTGLDPRALVRLRPVPVSGQDGPRTALWARLPWAVLVTRDVASPVAEDITVAAADLLSSGGRLPARRDQQWRWPLPPGSGEVIEELPAQAVWAVARAAAGTLTEVSTHGLRGRTVGSRVLRDALLDHVPIVVEAGDLRLEVPQRLVQAVRQMGFLGGRPPSAQEHEVVRVRRAGRWVGLAARYGTGWLPPPSSLAVRPR